MADAGTKRRLVWLSKLGKNGADKIKWVSFLQGGWGPVGGPSHRDVHFAAERWLCSLSASSADAPDNALLGYASMGQVLLGWG